MLADTEQGVASGAINTAQQIGAAVGLAALAALATSITTSALAQGAPEADALAAGFRTAFGAGAMIAGLGALVALLVVRGQERGGKPRRPARG